MVRSPACRPMKADTSEKLSAMRSAGENLDVITFSGNGEPTLHPDFAAVVKDTLDLRDRYFPDVKVSVLTNSTRLDVDRAEHRFREKYPLHFS